jgi:Ca-activated chloride channel family protein
VYLPGTHAALSIYDFFISFAAHWAMVAWRELRFSCVTLLLVPGLTALEGQKLAIGAAMAPAPAFKINSEIVLVPVSVTDNYGKTIVGLHAKDFNVFDDQKPQQIVSFANEDVPCSVGMVLDVSGSMRNALGVAKDGAQTFVRAANPYDEFLLLTVSTLPGAEPAFTSDAAGVAQNIAFTKPGGMTALIDTVYLGLNRMRKARHPQRALIIFSDGMDNHSQYSKNQLLRAALEADVQIYTIILPTTPGGTAGNGAPFRPSMIAKPGDRGPQIEGPELLETLAEKTGGLHFRARSDSDARDAVMKVGEALRNEYVIGFQPADSGPSGKAHRIRVTTTGVIPNAPKVYVHARSSYYTP